MDDTVSQTPIRYQLYDNTLRLSPNKDDLFHQTFGSLSKTHPMVKYHLLVVTPCHGKASLHNTRDDLMENRQEVPSDECGHFSIRGPSPKMGQTPGWDLRSVQVHQGDGTQVIGWKTRPCHHRASSDQCVPTSSPNGNRCRS